MQYNSIMNNHLNYIIKSAMPLSKVRNGILDKLDDIYEDCVCKCLAVHFKYFHYCFSARSFGSTLGMTV